MTCHNYDVDGSVRTAAADEDAEWQRVNSYVADVLKDCYVLFAKLARLRGDFAGSELSKLDSISAHVRDLGQELAKFSKAFNEGEYSMNRKEQFGGTNPDVDIPADFEPEAEDFDFGQEESEEPEPEDFDASESEDQGEDQGEDEDTEKEE